MSLSFCVLFYFIFFNIFFSIYVCWWNLCSFCTWFSLHNSSHLANCYVLLSEINNKDKYHSLFSLYLETIRPLALYIASFLWHGFILAHNLVQNLRTSICSSNSVSYNLRIRLNDELV
jgi:hypothetical protein